MTAMAAAAPPAHGDMHKFDIIEDESARRRGGLPQRFRRQRLLGKGGFAKCYEVLDTESGQAYAAKIVSKASVAKPRALAKLRSEIAIHRSLNHDKVVKFYEYFEDSENVYILLELCPNHTLNEFMWKRPCKRMSESEAMFYVYELIVALKYLHGRRVIHRDLKLGNLFLDDDARLKVGDFGLAAQLDHPDEKKRTICGTPNYIAPEILEGKNGHSFEVDIWSLGVIIYTMLFSRPPFETTDVKATYRKIRYNQYEFPAGIHVSEHAKTLISSILRTEPRDRPTLDDILAAPWFGGRLPPVPASTRVLAASTPRVDSARPRSETPEREVPDFARIDSPAPQFAQRDCSPAATARRSQRSSQPNLVADGGFSTPGRQQLAGARPPLAQRSSNNENVAPSTSGYGGEYSKAHQLGSTMSRRPLSAKPTLVGTAPATPLGNRWAPNTANEPAAPPLAAKIASEPAPTSRQRPATACWPLASTRGNEENVSPANLRFSSENEIKPLTQKLSQANIQPSACRPQSASGGQRGATKEGYASKDNLARTEDDENARVTSVRCTMRGAAATLGRSPPPAQQQQHTQPPPSSTTAMGSGRLRNQQGISSASRLRTSSSASPAVGGTSPTALRSARGQSRAGTGREVSPTPSATQALRNTARQQSAQPMQPALQHGGGSSTARLAGGTSSESCYSASLHARTTCAAVRSGPASSRPESARLQSRDRLAQAQEAVHDRTPRTAGGGPHARPSCSSPSPPGSTGTPLPGNAREEEPGALPELSVMPEIWITKWVDYSSKYGVGYTFSDGSLGVYFNDSTKIIYYAGRFDYITRRTQDKPEVRTTYTFDDYPEDLKKKVTLLRHFKHYMTTDTIDSRDGATMGESALPLAQEARAQAPVDTQSPAIFLRKWTQNKHAILFQFSNKVVQVVFTDKTEALLSSKTQMVTYVDSEGQVTTSPLSSSFDTLRPELAKRLQYARELVNMLGNRAPEP